MAEQKGRTKREQCPVVYAGPSYPRFRGSRCMIGHHPHEGVRHYARVGAGGGPIQWWTEEEKARIRAARDAEREDHDIEPPDQQERQ